MKKYIILIILGLAVLIFVYWNYAKPIKNPDATKEEVKQAEEVNPDKCAQECMDGCPIKEFNKCLDICNKKCKG